MFAYTIVCAAVLKLRVETAERKALSTYLLFLVLFSAGAGFSYKYGGSSLPVLLGIFSFLTILVLIMIRVSLTFHMPADSSTYACPWVPILPALGMAFNVFQNVPIVLLGVDSSCSSDVFIVCGLCIQSVQWWLQKRCGK